MGFMWLVMGGLVLGSIVYWVWSKFHPGVPEMYEKLKKQGYSDEEIAEAYVFPTNMSKKEKAKVDKEFSEMIRKRRERLSPEHIAEMKALQAKYKKEDGNI